MDDTTPAEGPCAPVNAKVADRPGAAAMCTPPSHTLGSFSPDVGDQRADPAP